MNAPHHGGLRHAPLAGIALIVLATLLFAGMDTISQWLMRNAGLPLLMGVWGRYTSQALVSAAIVLPVRRGRAFQTRHLPFHLLRGVLLFGSTLLVFLGVRYIPLGELTAITMLAPMIVTLAMARLWQEHVSPLHWVMVVGGFLGVLVIMRPGSDGFSLVMLIPLAHVVVNSAFQILTSRMARTEHPMTMHLYTGLVGMACASALLPWAWEGPLALSTWLLMALMGTLGGAGHFILILAYQRAPSRTLMPYVYGQIGFAMLGGWIVFAHVPDAWSFAGMAMIAACGAGGAWLTLREMREMRESRDAARASAP